MSCTPADATSLRRYTRILRGHGYSVEVLELDARTIDAPATNAAGADAVKNAAGALAALTAEHVGARTLVIACARPTKAALPLYERWTDALNELRRLRSEPDRYIAVAWSDERTVPATFAADRVIGLHRPLGPLRLLVRLGTAKPFDAEPEEAARDWSAETVRGDVPAEVDAFRFVPLARSVAEIIEKAPSPRPRTISVEAPWGAGKSTFLAFVERELRAVLPAWRIIKLSPWKFDKAEAVWADFARQLEEQVDVRWPETWARRLRLAALRFDWAAAAPDVTKLALAITAILFAIFIAAAGGESWNQIRKDLRPTASAASEPAGPGDKHGASAGDNDKKDGEQSNGVAFLFSLLLALPSLSVVVGIVARNLSLRSLATSLVGHAKDPDYASRMPFLHTLHEDLPRLLSVYITGPTVVMVDDLDRCEIPITAEIFQAINLMLPEHDDITFILAFDREKVAAAFAARHDKLLPLIAPTSGDAKGPYDRARALAYGQNFMQKFIHLPIRLPRLSPNVLAALVAEKTAPAAGAEAPAGASSARTEHERRARLVEVVAPVLEGNPRRIKHFLNTMVVYSKILEIQGAGHRGSGRWPTMEHLAKFTAINLRWPDLVDEIGKHPELLQELEEAALDPHAYNSAARVERPRLKAWLERSDAEDLLKLLEGEIARGDPRRSFAGVEVGPLVALAADGARPRKP